MQCFATNFEGEISTKSSRIINRRDQVFLFLIVNCYSTVFIVKTNKKKNKKKEYKGEFD